VGTSLVLQSAYSLLRWEPIQLHRALANSTAVGKHLEASGMTGPPNDLKQRLERKATFEAAVKDLTCAIKALGTADTPATAADLTLVPRVHTLLKARYSNPAFWKAGLELFKAVQVGCTTHACKEGQSPFLFAILVSCRSCAMLATGGTPQVGYQHAAA